MRQPFDSGLYGIAKFSGTYVSVNVEKRHCPDLS